MPFVPGHLKATNGPTFNLFASNLRFLRKRKGLNQEDISRLFNKKPNTVGNWENGKTEPSIPELLVISGYFGVNLEDLLRSELQQAQAVGQNQLSLWPETPSRIPAPMQVRDDLQTPEVHKYKQTVEAAPADSQPAARSRTYNNEGGEGEPFIGPGPAPARQTEPAPLEGGDAMWFMLRELRSMQERLDRLQLAFDHSRNYRPIDKSDH